MPSNAGAEPEELVGARLGRYELVKRIAYGGMAEIFLAHDTGVKGVTRKVVVKRILPNITEDKAFVDMFLDEARIAARLSHQNIAHVYDFGETDGRYYIAMEYVDGLSLSSLLNACRPEPLPVEHAARIGSLLAQALYYAHNLRSEAGERVGVVHRDVSPQNVLISYDGQVKLVDFGIAKAADQVHHTEAGVLKGKYAYMAPEQCVGKPYDHRVDIFSLGTLLHESLTGSRLFKRENAFQTMQAVTTEPIPAPSEKRPGLPPRLDAIVLRALARDPKDRYPSGDELALDLEQFMQEHHLISNQILLGRFISSKVEKSDELARLQKDGGGELGSASGPSWSAARPVSDRVSQSDISRLRRAMDANDTVDVPVDAETSEAEGDTEQHDVSAFAGVEPDWEREAEEQPESEEPEEKKALERRKTFKVPPPARVSEVVSATEPSLEALEDEETFDGGPVEDEAGGAAVDRASPPRTPDRTEKIFPPGAPPVVVSPPPVDLRKQGEQPGGVAAPRPPGPASAGGRRPGVPFGPAEEPVTIENVPPTLDVAGADGAPPPPPEDAAIATAEPAAATDPFAEPPAATDSFAEPPAAADLFAEPPAAADLSAEPFASDPSAEPSEVVLPGGMRSGLRGLVLLGAVVAFVAFVVVVGFLGLRSVVRGPDDQPAAPTPSEPTVPGVAPPQGPEGPTASPGSPSPPGKAPGKAPGGTPGTAPRPGRLVVALEGEDSISVDGAPAEVEGVRAGVELEPGEHEVQVVRPGHRVWTKRFALEPGATVRLEPRPTPLPEKARPGKLYINSRPWSHAYLNGRKVGTTPIVGLAVPPGRHTIKLVAVDGREKRRQVRIRPGGTSKVFVEF